MSMRTYRSIRAPKVGRLGKVRRVAARLAFFGAACGAVVLGYVQLTKAESLAIQRVLVEGAGPERADEIRALLNVKPGDNLLFADLDLARARAASHPWVASVSVKRELPDTLRVVIAEREPLMILSLDRLYYVDAAGEPFKMLVPGDVYDLPVLTGLMREDLLRRAGVAREAIAGGLELIEALKVKDSPLPPSEVSEIVWDPAEGYSVVAVSGLLTVRFGRGDYRDKLARLGEVRGAIKGERDATEIDLTYSSRVIVAR